VRRVGLLLKRALDVGMAAAGLVGATPLLVATAAAIKLTGQPVFFRQARPGWEGRIFELIKFRTMRDARDTRGLPLPDSARLTRLGKFLRTSSIDELPQLWNVLRGDMSFVGPRPLLVQYLPLYTATQARRHEMRPGITGWAQVHGRNRLSWEEKFELDVWYIDHWSVFLDVKILALTVLQVVRRRGISSEGHATMPEFRGAGPRS
jgi:sugar transferase EpsL